MSKSAIDGASRGNIFYVNPEQINLPGIDYPCGPDNVLYNPRNQMPVSEELASSILSVGVLQNIAIKKDDKGALHVVYGNQRVRAARLVNERLKEAGKQPLLVPCVVNMRGRTEEEISESKIAENEIRRESPPLVKAEEAALHLKRMGGDVKAAARAFGVSEQYFGQLLTLREAQPEVKEAVRAGELSATAAAEVARLSPEEQLKQIRTVIASGGTIEGAKAAVKAATGKAAMGRPSMILLKKLVASQKDDPQEGLTADESFWLALRWVCGEIKAKDIPGLVGLIKEL